VYASNLDFFNSSLSSLFTCKSVLAVYYLLTCRAGLQTLNPIHRKSALYLIKIYIELEYRNQLMSNYGSLIQYMLCCSSLKLFCVVLLCAFTFWLPSFDVRYDFGSYTKSAATLATCNSNGQHLGCR
jgi:hypothetical protein